MVRNTSGQVTVGLEVMTEHIGTTVAKSLSATQGSLDQLVKRLHSQKLAGSPAPVEEKVEQVGGSINESLGAIRASLDKLNEQVGIKKSEEQNMVGQIGSTIKDSFRGTQDSQNRLNEQLSAKEIEGPAAPVNAAEQIGAVIKDSLVPFKVSLDRLNDHLRNKDSAQQTTCADTTDIRGQILANARALYKINIAYPTYEKTHHRDDLKIPALNLMTVGEDSEIVAQVTYEVPKDISMYILVTGVYSSSAGIALDSLLGATQTLLKKNWHENFFHEQGAREIELEDGSIAFRRE